MLINILEYFNNTALNNPEKIAVIENNRNITFLQLYKRARKLGETISRKSTGLTRTPVAVFLDKQIETVISDIGILYSGNAYMNLDTKTPLQRIKNLLELIQPTLIITNNQYYSHICSVWDNNKIIDIDSCPMDHIDVSEGLYTTLIDTDPLCIINTSGSTGVPKGVVLNHRSFIDFTEWAINTTKINEKEIIGSLSPVVFDIFSFELCMMMALSSTIMIIPDGLAAFPAKILQLLKEFKVTYIFWVPTIMVNIANMDLLSRISLPLLRSVWFAGEVFPTKQFNYWRRSLEKAQFINLYGPIEITLDCTYYIADSIIPESEPVPIGIPCKNTDILILNDQNKLCERNEEGELCVRGTSLAMGYYNNPEKTASAFVQNPLNKFYPETIYRTGDIVLLNESNLIIFKGRKDTLIKHSGYRIELGEIEHVLINTLKIAKNGCAVYNKEKKNIIFYYEAEHELSVSIMRKKISEVLPKYMIPNVFVWLKELPRNTNGKIDRLKLKELAVEKPAAI